MNMDDINKMRTHAGLPLLTESPLSNTPTNIITEASKLAKQFDELSKMTSLNDMNVKRAEILKNKKFVAIFTALNVIAKLGGPKVKGFNEVAKSYRDDMEEMAKQKLGADDFLRWVKAE